MAKLGKALESLGGSLMDWGMENHRTEAIERRDKLLATQVADRDKRLGLEEKAAQELAEGDVELAMQRAQIENTVATSMLAAKSGGERQAISKASRSLLKLVKSDLFAQGGNDTEEHLLAVAAATRGFMETGDEEYFAPFRTVGPEGTVRHVQAAKGSGSARYVPDPEGRGTLIGVPSVEEQKLKILEAEATAAKVKRQENTIREADMATMDADRAIDKVGPLTTGVTGMLAEMVPGTDRNNLVALIDTVKAIVGFAKLQGMREASKTGAALGNVTVREIEFLQAVEGSLSLKQSPEQLIINLERIRDASKIAGDTIRVSQGNMKPAEFYAGNIFRPITESDFAELPSGTRFVNPSDGVIKRK